MVSYIASVDLSHTYRNATPCYDSGSLIHSLALPNPPASISFSRPIRIGETTVYEIIVWSMHSRLRLAMSRCSVFNCLEFGLPAKKSIEASYHGSLPCYYSDRSRKLHTGKATLRRFVFCIPFLELSVKGVIRVLMNIFAQHPESTSAQHNPNWYRWCVHDSSTTIDMYIQLFKLAVLRPPSYVRTELIVLDTHLHTLCTSLEKASCFQPYPYLQQREVACLQILKHSSRIRAS